MYRRPKFLEILLEIRREMALDADYDVDLFAELARSGTRTSKGKNRLAQSLKTDPPAANGKATELTISREK